MKVRGSSLALSFVVVAAGASGCIAVVTEDGSSYGGTCHFQGDTATACGKCIAGSCQPQVNACCKDGACGPLLTALDACGSGSGCYLLSVSGVGSGDNANGLRTCIDDACAAPCGVLGLGDGGVSTKDGGGGSRTDTSCDTIDTSECLCSYAGPGAGNGSECSPSTVHNAVCCGDIDWPASNLHCTCETFSCQTTTDGCDCQVGLSANLDSCDFGTCCTFGSSCHCGSTPCTDPEMQVPKCTAAAVGCSGDTQKIESWCAL